MILTHLHDVSDLFPLLRPGVYACGVVGTRVQQDHTLFWDVLSPKILGFSLLIPHIHTNVHLNSQSSVFKDIILNISSSLQDAPCPESYRNVFQSSFKVEATGGGVIVSVSFQLHASISEDGCVVSPGRFGQVHIMGACMESSL